MACKLDHTQSLLQEVQTAIAFKQPGLEASIKDHWVVVEGTFNVTSSNEEDRLRGKLGSFKICLGFPPDFPKGAPILFETGDDIPKKTEKDKDERHINGNGSCCFGVWASWFATRQKPYIKAFLYGPINGYLFGQLYFSLNKKWPNGWYHHNGQGILENFSETLKCPLEKSTIERWLIFFSKPSHKGHCLCPCNSKRKIRNCCTDICYNPPIHPEGAEAMYELFKKYCK